MSILIKGMEMPKDGRIKIQIGADGAVYFVEKCRIMAEKYEKSSHAAPLPEKYGRLIDADAFCRFVANNSRIDGIIAAGIISYVNAAPTIVPAEGVNDNG